MSNDADYIMCQSDLDVDIAFEDAANSAMERVGDGHFYNDVWIRRMGMLGDDQEISRDGSPLLLHTSMRWAATVTEEDGTETATVRELVGRSIAHDRHPYVALLSLLRAAEKTSSVYISAPYLTDFQVLDQLCHYANPEYGGLKIYVILGPASFNTRLFRSFIRNDEQIRLALSRLHIKIYGDDGPTMNSNIFHSKAFVSTAGAMVGSYNYTNKARLVQFEHSVMLGEEERDVSGLREELRVFWDDIPGPPLDFPAQKRPGLDMLVAGQSFKNPYANKK